VKGNTFGTPYSYVILGALIIFVVLCIILVLIFVCCKCCCVKKDEDDFELNNNSKSGKKNTASDYYTEERNKRLKECLDEPTVILDLTRTDPVPQPFTGHKNAVVEDEESSKTPPPEYKGDYILTPANAPSSRSMDEESDIGEPSTPPPEFPGYKPPQAQDNNSQKSSLESPKPSYTQSNDMTEFDTDFNDLEKTLKAMQADLNNDH
jgi:hypothetical protein